MKAPIRYLPASAIKIFLPEFSPARLKYAGIVSGKKSSGRSFAWMPPGSILVDAPFLNQPSEYSCALAAASIARMYGLGPESSDEFLEGMKTKKSGTSPRNIASYLNKLGLKARIRQRMSKEEQGRAS